MKDLVSNCFICGEKALHVAGTEEAQVMQCISCGYTTSTKLNGKRKTNEFIDSRTLITENLDEFDNSFEHLDDNNAASQTGSYIDL